MTMTLPLTDVKTRLSELVQTVETTHDSVEITRNGRVAAVLISTDELFALRETLAIMNDPELMADIAESKASIARGDKGTSVEEMYAILRARLNAA